MNAEKPKAKMSGFSKVVLTLVIIIIGLKIMESVREPYHPIPKQPTAAEVEAKAQYKWATAGALALQKRMNDPDSFKLESAMVMSSGAACYKFRAKNRFGGYQVGFGVVPKSGIVVTSDQSIFAQTWEIECGGKHGKDYTQKVSLYF